MRAALYLTILMVSGCVKTVVKPAVTTTVPLQPCQEIGAIAYLDAKIYPKPKDKLIVSRLKDALLSQKLRQINELIYQGLPYDLSEEKDRLFWRAVLFLASEYLIVSDCVARSRPSYFKIFKQEQPAIPGCLAVKDLNILRTADLYLLSKMNAGGKYSCR